MKYQLYQKLIPVFICIYSWDIYSLHELVLNCFHYYNVHDFFQYLVKTSPLLLLFSCFIPKMLMLVFFLKKFNLYIYLERIQSRDVTLPTKVRLVKAMVFPVVMYGCESWTVKKAERRRIDAFELWYWRRLLRVPWTARRSNQSILKEISPGISLEGMMLKLKLQFFGHLM